MADPPSSTATPTPDRRQQLLAAVLVFIGAICFSAKAVLVKLAYRHEVDSISLLALRMLFSLPFFLLLAWWSTRRSQSRYERPRGYIWLYIILVGITGYYLASLFDFLGLQYIGASMERLILFVYPTLVVLISAIFFKQAISRDQYVALGLTYVGIALAFSQGLSLQEKTSFLLGGGLIFLSALTFAIYLVGSGRLLPRYGTLRFTSYAMMAASVAVLIHHGVTRQWALFNFARPVYELSFLMAVFATVLPAFLVSEGIRLIGAGNAAIIGSVGPISTIVLAYVFLDERLGIWQWIGAILVITGVLLISLRRQQPALSAKK